jgi:sarcosine oxidase subunit gamma
MQRIASSLGFALPAVPNTVRSEGNRRSLWLGPDEWLLVGPDGLQDTFQDALRVGLAGAFGSIVDVSANRTTLEIGGAKASELLAHGVAIDLEARSFGPNHCAQTLLAKAQVIIEHSGDAPTFYVYIRSSFASYAAEWLLDAGSEPTR